MSTVRDFTIRRLLLHEHAYVGLITHFLRYMYKVFTYVIFFLMFASGGFSRRVCAFLCGFICIQRSPSINTSICTRILSYIIVNWSSLGRCKHLETCFEKSTNPLTVQDLYYAHN